MSMVFCRGCGKEIHESAPTCPYCGAPQKTSNSENEIPDGVRGWSWGAFFLNWIWAIGNRTWIGLLAVVPYVGFIMAIVLGFKGREWAWKNKEWASVEEFNRVQRKWSAWGVGIVVVALVIGILAAIAIPQYQNYTERAQEAQMLAEQMQEEARQAEARAQMEEQMRLQAEAQAKHEAELMAQREQAALQASPSTDQWNTQATSPQDMQFSPSFDCQRASNGAERLICSNRELAAADVRLAQVYRELMGSGVDRDSLRRDQNEWRRNVRDVCFDANCMLAAYSRRLKEFGAD